MSRHKKTVVTVSAAVGLLILVSLFVGTRMYGTGNLTRARQIAARLQAGAVANPNPNGNPGGNSGADPLATTTAPTSASGPGGTAAAPTTAAATGAHPTGSASAPGTTAAGKSRTAASPATTSTPNTTGKAATTTVTAPPTTAAAMGARRQPTSGEVAQAITAVHSAIPFITPTPADIASAGNQVCTAFDQGASFAQVKTGALNMVGAGSLAWLIPSSVPDVAVRTLVALYCPGYAARLK